jgi:hypothetical protein
MKSKTLLGKDAKWVNRHPPQMARDY